jgi:hypothetical protein
MITACRYAVAISHANATDVDPVAVLPTLFKAEAASALVDGRRGQLMVGRPPLHDSSFALERLGSQAAELRVRASAYVEAMAPWSAFSGESGRHVDYEVTTLSEPWHEFPGGSLVLKMTTGPWVVAYIRSDVIVGHNTGNIFHAHARAASSTVHVTTIDDGSADDEALTLAEYASFAIPCVGNIVAGVINVLHNRWRTPRRDISNKEVVDEIGEILKKLLIEELEAQVMGQYKDYASAFNNAKDDKTETIADFAATIDVTLDRTAHVIDAYNQLSFDAALLGTGVRAWAFTASFVLLAYRHAVAVTSQQKSSPIYDSAYWRRLGLTYAQVIGHLGSVMREEEAGRARRLKMIGPVYSLHHSNQSELGPGGKPVGGGGKVFDGCGFDDGDQKPVRFVQPSTSAGEDKVRAEVEAQRANYVADKNREYLEKFYGEKIDAIEKLRVANRSLLAAWYENSILSSVKDWNPVTDDDYPKLGVWPPCASEPALIIETLGQARVDQWKNSLPPDAGEIREEYLTKDAPVWRWIGNGGSLVLKVPHKTGVTYALRIRYQTDDDFRVFCLRWAGIDSKEKTLVVAPYSRHRPSEVRPEWATRTLTIPVKSSDDERSLVISGDDAWAPDIVSLEWFELENYPDNAGA